MDEADSDWCFVTSLEFVHVLCRGPHYPKGTCPYDFVGPPLAETRLALSTRVDCGDCTWLVHTWTRVNSTDATFSR
ncbi:hypothetical protein ACSQ67_014042 [Phaseolus vulgaris]